MLRTRPLTTALISLGALVTALLLLYTYSSASLDFLLPASLRSPAPRTRASCPPEAYAAGKWSYAPRSDLTHMSAPADALPIAGFSGCASTREFFWHLASDTPDQWDRFPNASSFAWTPPDHCHALRPFDPEDLLRDLVERGGWLLLGDSITEGHFFSLSCLLHPHVRATPNYTENPYFDRAWPQHLYLSPSSPLLPTLALPPGFSLSSTPLVTFRRVDLLLSKPDLAALHRATHAEPPAFSLFSDETLWSLSPADYMPLFTAPLPDANYATLVASTAGHWTTTVFGGYRDDARPDDGFGIEGVLAFFATAMQTWAREVQQALDDDRQRRDGGPDRQVVVRAYLPGHEDCHNWRQPWEEDRGFAWPWYNWPWIKDFNKIFQETLESSAYPDVHYLPIDRPARLRPDAHATGDCLHIMAGAGVLEGWTHYIWHYVTRELVGRIR